MTLLPTIQQWWKDQRQRESLPQTSRRFLRTVWDFARESTPDRRRRRYGDIDFDWERRVDTTEGTVGWKARLLGMFHSSYQPTEPEAFREMIDALDIDFPEFTFIDIGSGKGRVLLLASDYPFRRILGVELLPELHRVAQENIARYQNPRQRCFALESLCADAREFAFPPEPTLLYFFNPLPEPGFGRVIENLGASLRKSPRPLFVLYHNPVWERLVAASPELKKIGGKHQYSVFANSPAASTQRGL